MKISIVIPAYNEAKNLPIVFAQLCDRLEKVAPFEIIAVDDGSTDGTLDVLVAAAKTDQRIRYVSLSRNFGHQAALRAGLAYCSGDCAISMDGDLQHPVDILPEMIALWRSGYQVVTTKRIDTDNLPFAKRLSSRAFYVLINLISDVKIEPGSADFRLIDRKVLDIINELTETDFFLRGIVPWAGFKVHQLTYRPNERASGSTKYNISRMISFALSGIISSSIQPLRLATLLAATLAGLTLMYAFYAVLVFLTFDRPVEGWTSVVMVICIIGSLQLFVLGVIGEYIGRILRESRKRPAYVVAQTNCLDANTSAIEESKCDTL